MNTHFALYVGLLLFLFIPHAQSFASTNSSDPQVCQTPPLPEWTENEQGVWNRICAGDKACLDPSQCESRLCSAKRLALDTISETHSIRASFLMTLMLEEPWKSAVPRQGVRLFGARIEGTLDLENATIEHELKIENSFFINPPSFRRMRTASILSLKRNSIPGKVTLESIIIDGSLLLCHIESTRTHNGTEASLLLDRGKIGGSIQLGRATAREVLALGTDIGGAVFLTGAQFSHRLALKRTHIRESLSTSRENPSPTFIAQLSLTGAEIDGYVDLNDTIIQKSLDASHIRVGGAVNLGGADIVGDLDFKGARIDGELALLTGEKHITRSPGVWNFENSRAWTLRTNLELWWPKSLNLGGFEYQKILNNQASPSKPHKASTYIEWLAQDKSTHQGPYKHISGILRNMGYNTSADNILYAWREKERRAVLDRKAYAEYAWNTALMTTIGYGYGHKLFRAAAWAALFVFIGVLVLARRNARIEPTRVQPIEVEEEGRSPTGVEALGVWYCIDLLLPAIRLRKKHYDMELDDWTRRYFYIHQLLGYVLGFFLLAGLAGLTGTT